MGDKTTIEWADATWNPIIGCSRVGPGCDHCYAIGVVHREMSPQHVGLTIKRPGERTDWTGEVRPAPQVLDKPLHWRRPRRIFVNSLSDLFHPDLPDTEIAKVFAVMALAPQHTFQVLTKRPQRMATLLADREFVALVDDHREATQPGCGDFAWPLPNVWLGTSIESDRYTFRADHLRATPAAVRWISAEPLLGALPSLNLTGIDWLVVGGESGPGARPMHPDWARDLRDQCVEAGYESSGPEGWISQRVPFLFKQWGDWIDAGFTGITNGGPWIPSEGRETLAGEPDSLGFRTVMRRVGKKAAGRELDGRTWDEYPA